jgi:hypothetical protein
LVACLWLPDEDPPFWTDREGEVAGDAEAAARG